MAELLIKADEHWMEAKNRALWPSEKINKYDRRIRKGSPIVVMPDDHEWGREESLPKFIIIKIPGTPVDEAKDYLVPKVDNELIDDPTVLLRRRYRVPADYVDTIIEKDGITTMTFQEFQDKIIDDG